MKNNNSAISLCQPSCGYYFSSGCYVSETVYSGNSESPHSPLYNAASRVVIDGGRKAVAYIAMAGMFAQNLEIAAYAETTAPSAGIYHAVMSYDSGAQISGMNPDSSTSWTIIGNVASNFILKNQWLNVKSGGSAFNTVLSSGGKLNISNGAVASNATVSSGGQINIKSGGSLHIATATAGGAINISAGGSAAGIKQESGGNVNVVVKYMPGIAGTYISGTNQDNGIFGLNYYTYGGAVTQTAVASNFIINSSGWQNVSSGGSSLNTVINGGGTVNVYSSGYTSDTTVYGGGSMYVYDGGVADTTTVNGGTLNIRSGGTANYASVSSGGTMNISRGGSANYASANSSGIINVSNGGTANYTVINATGTQNVYGSSISTTINSLGSQVVYSGGVADTTTVNNGGWQFIESSGTASNTVISSGGQQIISSGGLSISATIDSGGSQHIKPAGIASDTTINIGGWQFVSSGGSAINNIILSGASQTVESGGVVSNTVIESGGSQATSGDTSGMIISGGSQIVSSGATDTDATIYDGGVQHILDGGTANNATVNSLGFQIVSDGGIANYTIIEATGTQKVYGSAVSATVNSLGSQVVYNGGTADATSVNSGGKQIVSNGGIASGTTLYKDGNQWVSSGGKASGTIINSRGNMYVNSAGSAYDIRQSAGGYLAVSVGGNNSSYAQGTYYASDGSSRAFLLSGEVASGFTINTGILKISSGGVASDTILNSNASQVISKDGNAVGTIIYNAQEIVLSGGSTNGTIVNKPNTATNGQYVINGGTATATMVNSGGYQHLGSENSLSTFLGGTAESTVLSGGTQHISAGGIANYTSIYESGIQEISSGGTANYTVINATGTQNVYGSAVSTTINSLGSQIVYSGGTAENTSLIGNGVVSVMSGATAISVSVNSVNGSVLIDRGGKVSGASIGPNGIIQLYDGAYAENVNLDNKGRIIANVNSSGGTYLSGTYRSTQDFSIVGNTAENMVLHPGALLVVSEGAFANSTTVYSNADLILDTGTANGTIISNGGREYIRRGTDNNAFIVAVGSQMVSEGGTAIGAYISGGQQIVCSGGIAIESELNGYLSQRDGVTVYGATQTVNAGGLSINATANSAGYQVVNSAGIASNTVINSGGQQIINSSGTAHFAIVHSGGSQYIAEGGTAINTILFDSTDQTYATGATVSGNLNVVSSGLNTGSVSENISSGNAYYDTTINSGGSITVLAGAAAVSTTINDGILSLAENGYALHTTINFGGQLETSGNNTIYGNTVLNSGGIIRANKFESPWSSGVLTVENLIADGGTFYMNVDLVVRKGDKIQITESHSGNAFISLYNLVATAGSVSGTALKLVDYSDGAEIAPDASFSLANGTYEQGDYVYILEQGSDDDPDDMDYYLRSTGKPTSGANNAGSIPNLNGAGVGAALNSLQKRLGDLRGLGSNAERHGIWARSYYKNMTVKAHEDVKMDVSGLEAGWDFKLSCYDYSGYDGNYANKGLYLGLMAASLDISADGKGDGDGILGGMYATYIAEDGWFADFTLRGGRSEIDVITHTNMGTRISISPKRDFIAASVETGYTYDLRNKGEGWKIEPKAELQYMRMGSKEVRTNTSIPVRYGGIDYITGIGTVYAGYTYSRKNGLVVEPFAELSYKYEFDGEESIRYNTAYMESDAGGGTIEARLGVNMQLTSSLYWHAAANWEDGHSQKSYGADAGIRYMFGGK